MEMVQITSHLLWRSALVMALIDIPLLVLAARWVPPDLFRRLKWHLAGTAFVLYAVIWGVLGSVIFWEAVYRLIFPAWLHWLLPAFGLVYAALALLFWRVSLLAGRRPAVWFCLLGGMVSLAGHAIGIVRGLMSVPMLDGASAASALVFGVFEFIFYWCVITALAAGGKWLGLRLRGGAANAL